MKIEWKSCIKIAVSAFILYLAVHYWKDAAMLFKNIVGAASPLLIGAVRGAEPKLWGAHVPTDWYFGEPNDEVKSRKFMLAMQILYLGGADYVYAENDLFKTNAFSREDWLHYMAFFKKHL